MSRTLDELRGMKKEISIIHKNKIKVEIVNKFSCLFTIQWSKYSNWPNII